MAHEISPGTPSQTQVFFSNDAQTLLEVVCPANPLPVLATITPSGTQDVNIIQTGGVTQLRGSGATGTGSERVTVAVDSATVAGSASLPAGTAIIGKVSPLVSTTFTASQVTVPATANGILLLAANANRLGATISNPSTVSIYISSAATGLTTSNGFAIPAGSSYSIDSPLYTGALYGIVATSTQTAYVVELT
jgi:hypothetical protein